MIGKWMRFGAVVALGFLAVPASAQQGTVEQRLDRLHREVAALQQQLAARDTTGTAELRRQIEALTRELEAVRLGREVTVAADSGRYGLAPAASKVYRVAQGVSIGGYGEVLYENFATERENDAPSGAVDQFDALRAILYVGYKFSDRLLFNSELEWEHGSTGKGGEASIEFAYIDYLLTPNFGLRGGLLLTPMGLVNELHEPPIFLGTTRPLTEQAILPSTWRANGAGVFGEAGPVEFRAYLITSLDGVGGGTSKAGGFAGNGLRGGRQSGAREMAEDFAGVARVDFTGVDGVIVGGSAYLGETAHNRRLPGGDEVGGRAFIWEAHGDFKRGGLDLRGLYARATLDDVDELNQLRSLTGANSIGSELTGGYVHAGFNVLSSRPTSHALVPYVRYETLNTQAEVPTGFSSNPANDRNVWVFGAMWKPISNVSLKADFQRHRNEARTGVNQFNVNLGYLF